MPVIKAEARKGDSIAGGEYGATISVILDESEPGSGPRLHRHPYDETWVVQQGRVTFQLDSTRHPAEAGDIVIAPAGVTHKFTNDGPGLSKMVCVHASPSFRTEWLE
jgi:quercetin dioxygenase-like cupin family protein